MIAVVERAAPSVVAVEVRGKDARGGAGSGVLITPDGYALTNHHVIEAGSTFRVHLPEGRSAPATLIGSDPATDLAVLRVHASGCGVETTLSAITEQAAQALGEWADELSEGELEALRDPRNWMRPVAAMAVGGAAAGALVVVGARRRRRPTGLRAQAERIIGDIGSDLRR